jgi:hypothetical protein
VTINEGTVQLIVIGADAHKRSYSFAGVDAGNGELLDSETVKAATPRMGTLRALPQQPRPHLRS